MIGSVHELAGVTQNFKLAGGPRFHGFVSSTTKWVPHSFAEAGLCFFSFRERVGSTICAPLRYARVVGREEFYLCESDWPITYNMIENSPPGAAVPHEYRRLSQHCLRHESGAKS
jgi:hypothetical protein